MVIIAVSGFTLEWIEITTRCFMCTLRRVSGFALEWIEMKITMPTYYIVRSPASRWSELKYATSASNLGQLRLQLRAEADRNACRNTTTVLGIVFSFTPKAVTIVLTLNTPDKIRTLKLTST